MIKLSDLKLIERATVDPDDAEYVLSRVCRRVYQVVYMIVGATGDTDELSQMCLVEILEHFQQFRGEGTLESWAGQVAYRVVMRELKKRRKTPGEQIASMADGVFDTDTPERMMLRRELWEQLTFKLQGIPLKRRTALLLHLVGDYTIPEVAELTGVSVNTVKDYLKAAYRDLRAILADNSSLREAMLEAINE